MTGLLGAAFAEVILVTFRSVRGGGIKVNTAAPLPAPLPSLYLSVALIYGGLALLPNSLAPLPAMFGWGLVGATFLNLYNPGGANAAASSNAQLGKALSSNPTTAGAVSAPKK